MWLPLPRIWLAALVVWLAVLGVAQATSEADSYIIKADDTLRMEIFNEPKLGVPETRVSKTGEATFPLIGSVRVAGLSLTEASEKVRKLYDADWLVDPKVNISIIDYARETVSVLGSVRTPGQLNINPATGLDLATAIATVGGLTEMADPSRIELHRAAGGVAVYSQADVASGAAGKLKLASGDRVIVGQSRFVGKFVTLVGHVGKQGAVSFPINGKLDLVTAIAAANGLTELANPKKISINRGGRVIVVDYSAISKEGTRPYALEPGDIVTVPQRAW